MRYVLACLLLLFATPVFAQQVVVRSGDHPTFTRLVMTVPDAISWEISETREGYRFAFVDAEAIDVSRIFERIQRTRVADLRLDENGVAFEIILACDCFADAQNWVPGQLVVDIKDPGSTRSANPLPILPVTELTAIADVTMPDPPVPAIPATLETELSLGLLPEPQVRTNGPAETLTLGLLERGPVGRADSLIDPLQEMAAQQNRVNTLEKAIASGLNRAVSQGLLDGAEVPVATDVDTTGDETLDQLLADIETVLTPGITARTSVDAANAMFRDAETRSVPRLACIPDDRVNVAEWADEGSFAHQIGTLRTRITGEFDRTDPEAIEKLAKAYVFFGFGREAARTLEIDGANSQTRDIIRTIAQIIDDDPVDLVNFSQQVQCPGIVSVWGLLAHGDTQIDAEIPAADIVINFKKLPLTLRKHLAPRLAKALNRAGHDDFAENVLAIAIDAPIVPIEATLAATEIAIEQGNPEVAQSQLVALAEDNPRMSAPALLKLMKLKSENGTPVTDTELSLLRTLRFESQNSEEQAALYLAELGVMVASGDVDMILGILESPEVKLQSGQISPLRDKFLSNVLETTDDASFLEVAFDPRAIASDPILQNSLAKRLIELGFPETARRYIAEQTVGGPMMERRYLRAEAAGAMGNVEELRAHLAGINSDRANSIRAAVDIAAPIVLSDLETDDVPGRETISFRENETPLAAGMNLIARSENLRQDLSGLLEQTELNEIQQ